MRKIYCFLCIVVSLLSCEKPLVPEDTDSGNVVLTFQPTSKDTTRGNVAASFFTKLNVQLFDADGETMSVKLPAGTYTIVAVGHSSTRSATIKSPETVQFTASDGEKLTDTFCHCSTVVINGDSQAFTLPMYRVAAMIQFCLTDDTVPGNFSYFLMEYTGGSANFNPTTLEGITKSSQTERRIRNSMNTHQAYTFPYMATSCTLRMTVSGLDEDGAVIRRHVFENVPVTRNRITTYTGKFFEDGDGIFTQSDFGFVVHTDWDGEDNYTF